MLGMGAFPKYILFLVLFIYIDLDNDMLSHFTYMFFFTSSVDYRNAQLKSFKRRCQSPAVYNTNRLFERPFPQTPERSILDESNRQIIKNTKGIVKGIVFGYSFF